MTKFLYALNEHNNLIKINETLINSKYFCPNCHSEMKTKKGKIREHHFYHLNKECSFETYLHFMGKKILYEKINKAINNKLNFEIDNIKEYDKVIYEDENHIENEELFFRTFSYYNKEEIKDIEYFNSKFKLLESNKILFDYFENYINNLKVDIDTLFLSNKVIYGIKDNYSTSVLKKIPGDYQFYKLNEKEKNNLNVKWDHVKNNSFYEVLLFILEYINFIYRDEYLYLNIYRNIDLKKLEKNIEIELNNIFNPNPIDNRVEYIFNKNITLDFQLNNKCKVFLDSKKVGKFTPDVLLELNNKELICFEIANTHECSKEKKESNLNIIEIDIKSNIDLENLYNNKFNLLNIKKF